MCDKSFSEFKIQIFRTCTKTSADLIKVKSKSSQSQVLPKIAYYQILSAKTIKNDQEIPTLLLKAQKRTHFMREQDQRNETSQFWPLFTWWQENFSLFYYTQNLPVNNTVKTREHWYLENLSIFEVLLQASNVVLIFQSLFAFFFRIDDS